jgi:hypothetical protein
MILSADADIGRGSLADAGTDADKDLADADITFFISAGV